MEIWERITVTTPIESTTESPSTTAAPRRPTSADTELLGFAQTLELAARDLYDLAVAAGAGGNQLPSLAAIAAHHDAYAQAISAVIGTSAPQTRDEALFSSLRSSFDTKADSMARAAHDLENTLVATHQSLLAALDGTEGAALIASILIVEARHSAAMASLAGLSPTRDADAFFTTPAVQPLAPTPNA
jgi:hypothetical protein